MVAKRRKRATGRAKAMIRVSVSLPSDHYERLKWLADRHRVSVAWVVRRAVEEHLVSRTPLLDRGT